MTSISFLRLMFIFMGSSRDLVSFFGMLSNGLVLIVSCYYFDTLVSVSADKFRLLWSIFLYSSRFFTIGLSIAPLFSLS